jgi:glycerol-3-phosphate dehydrogenase (NAD+)
MLFVFPLVGAFVAPFPTARGPYHAQAPRPAAPVATRYAPAPETLRFPEATMSNEQMGFWEEFRYEMAKRKANRAEGVASEEVPDVQIPWAQYLSAAVAFAVVSRFYGPMRGLVASNIVSYLTRFVRSPNVDLEAGRTPLRTAGIEMLEKSKDATVTAAPSNAEKTNGKSAPSGEKLQVCIVGSGNWGSTAAKIIGENIQQAGSEASQMFKEEVRMWVFEEEIEQEDGSKRKLTEIINEEHENVKYLKGYKLPTNVKAMPDLKEAATGAKVFVWVLPHQFIPRSAETVKEVLGPDSISISMVKGGIDVEPEGLKLCSETISEILGTEVGVIMGANVAEEVARGDFCEATVAMRDEEQAEKFRLLFDAPMFYVRATDDVEGVELCGALKNVVALAAGFSDGLGMGSNTKAAVMRTGLQEMEKFIKFFYDTVHIETFFESCGVADLITTCFSGRNRKCAEAYAVAEGQREWSEIETELLDGQKLQGTLTLEEIWPLITKYDLQEELPLITQIYKISFEGAPPSSLFDALGNSARKADQDIGRVADKELAR